MVIQKIVQKFSSREVVRLINGIDAAAAAAPVGRQHKQKKKKKTAVKKKKKEKRERRVRSCLPGGVRCVTHPDPLPLKPHQEIHLALLSISSRCGSLKRPEPIRTSFIHQHQNNHYNVMVKGGSGDTLSIFVYINVSTN